MIRCSLLWVEAEVNSSYWVWLEEHLYSLRGRGGVLSVPSPEQAGKTCYPKETLAPWGPHLWKYSQTVASTHTTSNNRSKRPQRYTGCFFLETWVPRHQSKNCTEILALKKTVKNNSESARGSSRRRCPPRRREERRSVSALWERGAPHWITLPKMQIGPNVLVVWLYLLYGGPHICRWPFGCPFWITVYSHCQLMSLLFKESSVCFYPSGHLVWIDMAQPASGQAGVCLMKREICLAKMYGHEMNEACFVHGLSS